MTTPKLTAAIISTGLLLSISSQAAQLNLSNFDASNPAAILAVPLADSSGAAIGSGMGFITTGTFRTLDNTVIAASVLSPVTFQAMLDDFAQFGAGGTFGGAGAGDDPYLYNFDNAAPVNAGDDFAGNNIYTVATSASSLATAVDIFVYQHAGTYMPDAPLFTANAHLTAPGGMIVIGDAGGNVDTAAGTFAATQLVDVVPEPSTAVLALAGMCLFAARRRRN